MGFFDKLTKKLDKDLNVISNNEFSKQDIQIAKELSEVYINKNINKNSNDAYKFYLEGIFLGVTDRTTKHPYLVRTIPGEETGLKNSLLGFQGNKINYEPDENFDLNQYFNSNWFHPILDSYLNEKNDLTNSKKLYIDNNITFFDYFIKRLSVYDSVHQNDHIRYYEGINRKKYIELLRSDLRIIIR